MDLNLTIHVMEKDNGSFFDETQGRVGKRKLLISRYTHDIDNEDIIF